MTTTSSPMDEGPKHKDPYDIVRRFIEMGDPVAAKKAEEQIARQYPHLVRKLTSVHAEEWLAKFITIHPEMLELKQKVRLLSNVDDPVLITGETGTGKEILARSLHGRRKGNFVAVNCTSLPDELLESELFGHKKGAFTGAVDDRAGKFQYANGGTILLDEIGDMNIGMQTKLLRVLQDKKIVRLGDNVEIPLDFRLICSTNRSVEELISNKLFREDLYWRISTCRISTLPLRERVIDIPEIIKSLKKEDYSEFPVDINWSKYMEGDNALKGNVRQLQSIVRRWELFEERPM